MVERIFPAQRKGGPLRLLLKELRVRLGEFSLAVDLEVTAPATALFGPSGAGKSTLLECITGVRKPDFGLVQLSDAVLCDTKGRVHVPPEKRRVGYVPQDLALFPHKTVSENVSYGSAVSPAASSAITMEHVVAVLEIGPLLERFPGSLSGGEKQRVAFARALMASPKLLLLDEPLAGLDSSLRQRILSYLRRVRDEFRIPMIYVTHNANEVVELCEEVIFLKNGVCAAKGLVKEHFVPSEQPNFVSKFNFSE